MYVLASRFQGKFSRALLATGGLPREKLTVSTGKGLQYASILRQSGGQRSSRDKSHRTMASATPMVEQIKEKNEKYPVMIYAKSYCPYCGQVKGLFKKLGVDFVAVNLDELHEGKEIQDELTGLTGSHTVPQVFIKGEFIGGCDDTMDLNRKGKLEEKLKSAGIPGDY